MHVLARFPGRRAPRRLARPVSAKLEILEARDLPSVTGAAASQAWTAYGQIPLSFEANQGQTDSRVKFLSRGTGYTLFLTPQEAVLTLGSDRAPRTAASGRDGMARLQKAPRSSKAVRSVVLRISLVGANSTPTISRVVKNL